MKKTIERVLWTIAAVSAGGIGLLMGGAIVGLVFCLFRFAITGVPTPEPSDAITMRYFSFVAALFFVLILSVFPALAMTGTRERDKFERHCIGGHRPSLPPDGIMPVKKVPSGGGSVSRSSS